MENWKNLDDLFPVLVEHGIIQLEVTKDNHLSVCIFSYIDGVDHQIIIDFGRLIVYEIFEELMLHPHAIRKRSDIVIGQGTLFEIFNSKLLQELSQQDAISYHHYFISLRDNYLECVTTGIVNIEVR